ncbi:hypothetical protein ABTX81_30795 [Kitasatospora sp. NPDC097605]|uniref:hypothetical protein n=1 Tax=Kitasatospora sp. NPDC097605 TaxID=3157226 RepID=UPI0033287B80
MGAEQHPETEDAQQKRRREAIQYFQSPEGNEMATGMFLVSLTDKVNEGEKARDARAREIHRLYKEDPKRWTQAKLAELADISQPAVSQILAKEPPAVPVGE